MNEEKNNDDLKIIEGKPRLLGPTSVKNRYLKNSMRV
jgi:hypothetical protein